MVPDDAHKNDGWKLSGFFIDDETNNRRISLPLFKEDISFIIHRDIFKQKEWEVYLQEW